MSISPTTGTHTHHSYQSLAPDLQDNYMFDPLLNTEGTLSQVIASRARQIREAMALSTQASYEQADPMEVDSDN
jgi:hypothetical protein